MSASGTVSLRSLMDEAEVRAGTSEWGHLDFTTALEVLLDSCAETAALTADGWDVLRRTALRHLTNRLELQRSILSDPQATAPVSADLPEPGYRRSPDRALVLTGLPRTGTTLLHNLLAQDTRWRFLRLWEALRPAARASVRSQAERSCVERDLIRRAQSWLERFEALAPGIAAIHRGTAEGPEECDTLLQNSFASLHFEDMWNAEEYSRWLGESSLRDEYRYYRFQLDVLASADEVPRSWLLKSPGHLGHLDALAEVLPDAMVLWCHRHPAEAVASWASLIRAVRSPHTYRLDEAVLGRQALSRAWVATMHALEARRTLVPAHILDVAYPRLVADPRGTVGRVYAALDRSPPPEAMSGSQRWLDENPQHRHGRHSYTLAEFGLSASQVTERFAPYLERFGDLVEV